jgi:steroid 5-alpha reductase family enzyme
MPFFGFDSYNLLTSGLIIVAIQIVFFIFASALKTDKVTDLSYSMTFVVMALILLFTGAQYAVPQLLIALLITAWGLRLGGYLFLRIIRLKKDDRFDGIRENPLSFAGFWFLQAITIWLVLLPSTIVLSMQSALSVSVLTWVGAALWAIGFVIETVADAQKYRFRNDPSHKGKWIDRGLWRASRHPNYFGEMLCWWGLFLIAVPHLEGMMMLSIFGPIFITFMLLFVSGVPTVEKKAQDKYGDNPEFLAYKNRTSILVPLPPKRDKSSD